jgi:plastocyanin
MIKRLAKSLLFKAALTLCVVTSFAAGGGGYKIGQKNKTFSQSSITIKKGESITFVNDDSIAHNVYSTSSGNAFNLKTMSPGGEGVATFNTPGTVEVRCAIHPTMRMTVTVK